MDAGKRTLNEIFNNSRRLEIPFFQRPYVWRKNQWERFLEDMEYVSSNNEYYFLGPLILKQQMVNAAEIIGDVRLVVDGQQRLTTLSILMKVLSLKSNLEERFKSQFILHTGEPSLQHSDKDVEAYRRIMFLNSLDDVPGDNGIIKLYNFFKENADPKKLDYNAISYRVVFVGIDLHPEENEQQIFDTINSLGVPLTTADLLKNYFFGRNDRESYHTNWFDIFEKDDETQKYWEQKITTGRLPRTLIDLFFYDFLQIKIQDGSYDVNSEDKNNFSRMSSLFDSYKKFIKNYMKDDKSAVLEEIREYAVQFKKSISTKILTDDLTGKTGIDRINVIMFGLDTTTLLPYVLFVEKNVADLQTRNEIYEYLESFIMRRMAAGRSTKNYNHLFSEKLIFNRVLTREALINALSVDNDTDSRMPSDQEVIEAFHSAELINKYAAGVLYMIESKIRNYKKHTSKLIGIKDYTLEHLMPKNWTKNWRTELGGYIDDDNRNKVLMTLGNLAIITHSLNSSIRDAAWNTKKTGDGGKGGLERYASDLETLHDYLQSAVWNEELIYERAEFLADKALEVWKR